MNYFKTIFLCYLIYPLSTQTSIFSGFISVWIILHLSCRYSNPSSTYTSIYIIWIILYLLCWYNNPFSTYTSIYILYGLSYIYYVGTTTPPVRLLNIMPRSWMHRQHYTYISECLANNMPRFHNATITQCLDCLDNILPR